ncbi:MAG: hydroxyacid dehydrogenase [Propionibacteriaceae bacterium]
MTRLTVAFAMRSDGLLAELLPASVLAKLENTAELLSRHVLTEFTSPEARSVLRRADVLITGWGCPVIDAAVLEDAPRLRLVAHAAGSVKGHLSRAVWERGIQVTTAAQANAGPVADYTLAFILLAGKRAFAAARQLAVAQGDFDKSSLPTDVGNYGTTVGIIGASRVGRLVLERLRPFRFEVLLASPELTSEQAAELGAALVPLDELMSRSTVVSLHAPVLDETRGMIGRAQLAAMPNGATFINTARGALVDHDALRDETASGRISAVLDVTDPEPLPTGDPLFGLPNVILTPHIAGSMGNELSEMGEYAVREVQRFAAGEPLAYPVTIRDLDTTA